MVNTFFISSNPEVTAKTLDAARVHKQVVEAHQLLDGIIKKRTDPDGKIGWRNAPMLLMWEGYEDALKYYINVMHQESEARGTKYDKYTLFTDIPEDFERPWWWFWPAVHYSHMASLRRKDPVFYESLKGKYPSRYDVHGYVWPSKLSAEQLERVFNRERLSLGEIAEPINPPKPVTRAATYYWKRSTKAKSVTDNHKTQFGSLVRNYEKLVKS